MSFAFGFGGDDIEMDDETDALVQQIEKYSIADKPLIPPKMHTLYDLLKTLPSQISYNLLPVVRSENGEGASVPELLLPRRSVFDIRTQLMVEANPEENENDELLAGLERGDLTSGIYEGGFKTWECSLDLASLMLDIHFDENLRIIELGAGSAVPSLTAMYMTLKQPARSSIHFTLCDYNEDVLRLATAPNFFLASSTKRGNDSHVGEHEELDVDDEMIEECLYDLYCANLRFDFVSGAWGEDFVSLIRSSSLSMSTQDRTTLILASETIYSPISTISFTHTLMHLLKQNPARTKAWVAAKKVYFGVGGGVDDFVSQVRQQGGSVKTILDVQGAGVGRVVLEVSVG